MKYCPTELDNCFLVSQPAYFQELLHKYNMEDSNPVATPAIKAERQEAPLNPGTPIRQLISRRLGVPSIMNIHFLPFVNSYALKMPTINFL